MKQFSEIALAVGVGLCLLLACDATRNANEKLQACCTHLKQSDETCKKNYCNFNAISTTTILKFLSDCNGKSLTVGPMWDCASSRVDHTECCKGKGVSGDCLEYCAAHDGVPTNYLQYLKCLSDFDSVKQCFFDYLEKHPSLKGDN